MTSYTAVLDGSKTNVEGHSKFLNRLFAPGVATQYSSTSLATTQRGAGANMSVDVAIGDCHLQLPTQAYSFWCWTDSTTNVIVTAADPTNPRVDSLVAYCDTTATTTSTNNSPGSLKFAIIAGTPNGSPSAVTDTAIQAALGSTIAWTRLSYIYVGAGVTSITTSVITDARSQIAPLSPVGAANISSTAITGGYAEITSTVTTASTTDVQVPGLTATIMVPAGGRRARVTFFTPAGATGSNTITATYTLWDGSVGTGTQIGLANNTSVSSFVNLQATTVPTAGAKTYNVGYRTSNAANPAGISASANSPSYILVELI